MTTDLMLIDEMRNALPLYAYPTKQLVETLTDIHLSRKTRLEVDNIFYAGNDGGIMCSVRFHDQTVGVISATNLVFSDPQPIYAKINDYRRERINALALEHAIHSAPSVGRNAPCPCGSGKKYKKCCGM